VSLKYEEADPVIDNGNVQTDIGVPAGNGKRSDLQSTRVVNPWQRAKLCSNR
jgi:hypothetical protein